MLILSRNSSWCHWQGRAVGVVAGATRAFGRRTQGVWGAGPPTAGGELSGYQALKPPQINIDLTKSLKYESFVLPKLDYFQLKIVQNLHVHNHIEICKVAFKFQSVIRESRAVSSDANRTED